MFLTVVHVYLKC